ncbi:MAG: hypothetical protein U5R31_02470 [Acidimicrobiia bacterium]|nr:hypothetical protein [Acidimicrobiia bacterium]
MSGKRLADSLANKVYQTIWSTPHDQKAHATYEGKNDDGDVVDTVTVTVQGKGATEPDGRPAEPEPPEEWVEQFREELEDGTHYFDIKMDALEGADRDPADHDGVDPGSGGKGPDPNSPDYGEGGQPIGVTGGTPGIPDDGVTDPHESDDLHTRTGQETSVLDEHGGHIGEESYNGGLGSDDDDGLLPSDSVEMIDPADSHSRTSEPGSEQEVAGQGVTDRDGVPIARGRQRRRCLRPGPTTGVAPTGPTTGTRPVATTR